MTLKDVRTYNGNLPQYHTKDSRIMDVDVELFSSNGGLYHQQIMPINLFSICK